MKNLQIPEINSNIKSSYYAYVLRMKKGNLEKFLNKLSNKGIETSLMFISVYKHKAYEKLFGKQFGLCPISEKLDRETFTIPLHAGINDQEVDYVIDKIKNISN
jgi:perosamine synthetase